MYSDHIAFIGGGHGCTQTMGVTSMALSPVHSFILQTAVVYLQAGVIVVAALLVVVGVPALQCGSKHPLSNKIGHDRLGDRRLWGSSKRA